MKTLPTKRYLIVILSLFSFLLSQTLISTKSNAQDNTQTEVPLRRKLNEVCTGFNLGVHQSKCFSATSLGIHSQGLALFKASPKDLVDEVWQIVQSKYVDGTFNQVDWLAVRNEYVKNKSYSNQQEAYHSIRLMLAKLHDPYTKFLDPEQFKKMQMFTGEFTGIGITIDQDEKTKQLVVIALTDPSFVTLGREKPERDSTSNRETERRSAKIIHEVD